jgi:hypothetical protein
MNGMQSIANPLLAIDIVRGSRISSTQAQIFVAGAHLSSQKTAHLHAPRANALVRYTLKPHRASL